MYHYPHHIGSFNTATRHLSRLERDIYRDARDMYFNKESALDGNDFNKLARRLCCLTPEEIAALQFVLGEFFEQQEDGHWLNHECESVIEQYKLGQAGLNAVKSSVNDRQGRSRARRSAIYAALRAKGVVPDGKAKASELRELCEQHGVDLAALTVTQTTVTGHDDVTANHGSVTAINNQKQKQNQIEEKKTSSSKSGGDGSAVLDAAVVPAAPAAWTAVFADEFGVEVDGYDGMARKKFWPLAAAWVAAGVSVGQMRDAVARARNEATEAIVYLPAYVDRVLSSSVSVARPVSRQGRSDRGEIPFSERDYGTGVMQL